MNYKKGNISIILALSIIIVVVGLVIFALLYRVKNTKEPIFVPQTVKTSQVNLQENNIKNFMDTNKNTNLSDNRVSKAGDTLSMNYTGRLEDGTVFDSNVDPKFGHVEPFRFTLGAGQVIKGWDEGLVGMKIGEKKTLTILPEKGYGSRAVSTIPANSTLIFNVELIGIE